MGGAEGQRGVRLGALIRERRLEMGMTLERLGRAAGCGKSYLSLVETGRKGPPSAALLRSLEVALMLDGGTLEAAAALEAMSEPVRERLEALRRQEGRSRRLAEIVSRGGLGAGGGGWLDAAYRSGELRRAVEAVSGEEGARVVALPGRVPLINSVAAGYPTEFTDLGYPARVADEYVASEALGDPDAFAARVVGDSMLPEYREGDIVVFSPARDVSSGRDCFVRLEPDHESTFKRVFFEVGEAGEEMIRLTPLNPAFTERVVSREEVAGLYVAVSVTRTIG